MSYPHIGCIMIIDVSETDRFVHKKLIELYKLSDNVIQFNGGREALDFLKTNKANGSEIPEVILLDVMMPDMDGWEVYQQMKADTVLREIPVVVVTAKAQSIDKVLGLHIAKVDDYITKPFGPQELLESVEKIIGEVE